MRYGVRQIKIIVVKAVKLGNINIFRVKIQRVIRTENRRMFPRIVVKNSRDNITVQLAAVNIYHVAACLSVTVTCADNVNF